MTSTKIPLSTPNNVPKDFYKAVGRMRFATEERCRKEEALTHIPCGERYEERMKEPFNPPKCAQSKTKPKEHEKPFMYLDVNIGPGKTGRVSLYKGDDPQYKARSFAQVYQLNEEMEEGLYKLLLTYLDNEQMK